ncbi:RsiV family protein [Chitinophaga lutea]
MIRLSSFCLLLALFVACKPKAPKQTASAAADSTVSTPSPNAAPAFYKRLRGTIAGQPVTLHLMKTGPRAYSAWYAYDKNAIPIQLYFDPSDSAALRFSEYVQADTDHTIRGQLTEEGHFTGEWSGGKKSYPFDLHADNDSSVLFDVYTCSDSVTLFPGRSYSPTGYATNTIVWPSGGADETALAALRKALTPNNAASPEPAAFVRQPVDTFLRDYKSVRDDADTNELKKGGGMSWNWNSQSASNVVWNTWPLVVIENADYAFTGGAHGNHGSFYTTIDLAGGKILKKEDVFKAGYEKQLGAALEKSFRKKYNVPAKQPLNQTYLFDNHIAPNDNFFITPTGVCFNYTPYEIGPYALGQVSLFVPFAEIGNYVQEAYLR